MPLWTPETGLPGVLFRGRYSMFNSLKTFFERRIMAPGGVTSVKATEESLRLATAALLIEAVKADERISDEEMEVVKGCLSRKFGLGAADAAALMDLAGREAEDAPSLYGFTRLIDRGFRYEDKKEIIALLWEVVYADGVLDKHEEHLVRRIADLVQVSHRDFIEAKLRVKNGKKG